MDGISQEYKVNPSFYIHREQWLALEESRKINPVALVI